MGESTMPWRNTTHDWASTVDAEHLAEVRRQPATFAPCDPLHLILEVLAYAADEVECATGGCSHHEYRTRERLPVKCP
jgi:topoisomerase-4 subunit B